MLSHFNCVQLFAAQWTVASQAPLSMGFSRQEYWSGSGQEQQKPEQTISVVNGGVSGMENAQPGQAFSVIDVVGDG